MAINQAVLFTKPMGHTGCGIDPLYLRDQVVDYLKEHQFYIRTHRVVTGTQLATDQIIDQHYCVYSQAVRGINERSSAFTQCEGSFEKRFKKVWDEEIEQKRLLPLTELLKTRNITPALLAKRWEQMQAQEGIVKVQSGLLVGYATSLDAILSMDFTLLWQNGSMHLITRWTILWSNLTRRDVIGVDLDKR